MTQRYNGQVRYFDKLTGRGLIRNLDNGYSYFVHWSSIEGAEFGDCNKKTWVHLEPNERVTFEVFETCTKAQADKIKRIK